MFEPEDFLQTSVLFKCCGEWTEREFHWNKQMFSGFLTFLITSCDSWQERVRRTVWPWLHASFCVSVWAHKPAAVCTSITELNTSSLSLSLSTEEPKLVQRKSHLVFIFVINVCDSVSPLWVCVGVIWRHVGDSWGCPWPRLLEHQITSVGYWSSRRGLAWA